MERNAVHFRYCGKERESFPVLTRRKGKEMLSEKNGQVNMYGKWECNIVANKAGVQVIPCQPEVSICSTGVDDGSCKEYTNKHAPQKS